MSAESIDAQRYRWLLSHSGLDFPALLQFDCAMSLSHFIDSRLSTEKKVCTKCGQSKALTEFHKGKRPHLMTPRCKQCQREYSIQWREAKKAGLNTRRKAGVGKIARAALTREAVAEMLSYDPLTGEFTPKRSRGGFDTTRPVGTMTPTGYLRISVYRVQYTAHRLAWLLHYGKWPEHVINHKNGNKLDNRIENLEDITAGENTKHAHRNGLIRLPGQKSTVKLTAAQALEIRHSTLTVAELVRKYGVSGATVADVRCGRTWRNAEHLARGGIVLSGGNDRLQPAPKAAEPGPAHTNGE